MSKPRLAWATMAFGAAVAAAAPALADPRIVVSFNDPTGLYAAYHADLQGVAVAAGEDWLAHFLLPGAPLNLSVSIGFATIGTATGRSLTTCARDGSWAQGAACEIMTGIDPNGSAADIEIILGTGGYLQQELWFDPDPTRRLAAVPGDRTDAFSVLQHEFAHAIGFNGWRDQAGGLLPGAAVSSFDALVHGLPGSGGLFFTGAAAMALYGAPVPLTEGNYAHFGNWTAGNGSDLLPDLMNGLTFYRGTRYTISALDLAVMNDLGLPTVAGAVQVVPEPASVLLWLAGLGTLALWRAAVRQRTDRRPARAYNPAIGVARAPPGPSTTESKP